MEYREYVFLLNVEKIATLKSILNIGDQSRFCAPLFSTRVPFKNLSAITNSGLGLAILFLKCMREF